jgi:membrane-bound inhibitor of C-type lysozyme
MLPGDIFGAACGRVRRQCSAGLAAAALVFAGVAGAANTAPSRTFTTEWVCDDGRAVLFNAHPRRPREGAWVTYGGQRVAVKLVSAAAGGRYASADGRVVWHTEGQKAMLEFKGVLDRPLDCRPKPVG